MVRLKLLAVWFSYCYFSLQDQTRIALEVEEAVYDPKDNKLFLYTTSETCYAVSKVVRANADSIIEELVMKGYSDLTQFESEQDE